MATMKRRVIYLSDEEWAAARRIAEETNLTISTVVRSLLAAALTSELERHEAARRVRQIESVRTVARYDTRPIRPVPKSKSR